MILLLDKPLQKTMHRPLIGNMHRFAGGVVKRHWIFLLIFAIVLFPAYLGYDKTNDEVYYDMGQCLPQDMDYVIANEKLVQEYDIASTHMLLLDRTLSPKTTREMVEKMEQVDGVKYILSLESILGCRIPEEVLPQDLVSTLKSDRWELMLVNSQYKVASDAVNSQIDELNAILKIYDPTGMLIGEAPCMKDMIETTAHDFQVVNAVSILAIFLIIALVEKSITLPFLLITVIETAIFINLGLPHYLGQSLPFIAPICISTIQLGATVDYAILMTTRTVIETAIFINLGLPHYLGQSLPFIAPICISTIQLGATVDYAILMTTRYKAERIQGNSARDAVQIALATSIPSVVVSGMGLFAATFGVALYSEIDIIRSMCMLMARGAVVSMLCVIFILPALLQLCDKLVCKTTLDMRKNCATKEVISQ